MTHQTARREGSTIVKLGLPSMLALEAEKTRCAHEIGKTTQLFRVPKVLLFDPGKGRLDLEWLPGIVPMSVAIKRSSDRKDLVSRLGDSVAAIHKHLEVPAILARHLDKDWLIPGRQNVVLHGDLTLSNIQYDQLEDRTVILDWSMSPLLSINGTVGPREFDLTLLAMTMFVVPRRLRYFSRYPSEDVLETFLGAYFARSGYLPAPLEFVDDFKMYGRRFQSAAGKTRRWLARRLDFEWCSRSFLKYLHSIRFRAFSEDVLGQANK